MGLTKNYLLSVKKYILSIFASKNKISGRADYGRRGATEKHKSPSNDVVFDGRAYRLVIEDNNKFIEDLLKKKSELERASK